MTILNKFLSKLLWRDNHVRKKHDLKPASDEGSIRISPHISPRAIDGVSAQAIEAHFYAPELPLGVIPAGFAKSNQGMALDAANNRCYDYANSFYAEMNSFIGYGTLSEMATRSEYRAPTTTLAVEMTRKWIKIKTTGQGVDRSKITAIEQAFIKHRVQDLMRKAAEQDGFFGRAQIFIDIKGQENKQDLPLLIGPESIQKGTLKGFKNVEAIWTSPVEYNAIDPTDKWFFNPKSWFVMGKQVHSDRLLTLISHPLPDVLKPAFNFGGISMSQLLMPYVERFLRTSESISDLVHSFSITGIKTDLQATLAGGNGDDLIRRAELFNKTRDNRGLMILNHDTEEFFQHSTPLSGLDKLQAQAQEQMAAPCHIPLIKLLGITPSGLNSSSDSEIRVFYDYVHAMQEALFTDPLEIILKVIQLDLFGEIDSNITFDYEPLYELDGEALARVRKSDADTAQVLIHGGVISAAEERLRLVGDPNSGYQGLDGALPAPQMGQDAEFVEEDHPRLGNGRFTFKGNGVPAQTPAQKPDLPKVLPDTPQKAHALATHLVDTLVNQAKQEFWSSQTGQALKNTGELLGGGAAALATGHYDPEYFHERRDALVNQAKQEFLSHPSGQALKNIGELVGGGAAALVSGHYDPEYFRERRDALIDLAKQEFLSNPYVSTLKNTGEVLGGGAAALATGQADPEFFREHRDALIGDLAGLIQKRFAPAERAGTKVEMAAPPKPKLPQTAQVPKPAASPHAAVAPQTSQAASNATSPKTKPIYKLTQNALPKSPFADQQVMSPEAQKAANLAASKVVGKVTAPIRFDEHIISGEVSKGGKKVTGGHSKLTNVRVVQVVKGPNRHGVYKAKIEVEDPHSPGKFLPKTNGKGISSLFPASWSKDRIKVEVDEAYKNRTIVKGKNGSSMWKGVTPSGVHVEGYISGHHATVYPVLEKI